MSTKHAVGCSNAMQQGWRSPCSSHAMSKPIRLGVLTPSSNTALALNELLALHDVRRLALVTPYTPDVQQRIADNYRAIGVDIVAERHLSIRDNHAFGLVEPARLRQMIDEVAQARPQAIAT